ncbi:MAG TPA: HEAT repeat domain-containing protein [Phycisphaerales bacterium]|nr:HEAT repeat domain-containing protein [Phycisphaerales bacterium]
MPEIDRRLRALRRLRPDERAAALADVLPHASSEEREPLTLLLIELAADREDHQVGASAATALALAWRHIPNSLRQLALAACRPHWPRICPSADERATLRAGEAVAEWALDASHPAALPLLARVLDGATGAAPAAAATALLALAVRASGENDPELLGLEAAGTALRPILDPGVEAWSADDLGALAHAVARGVASFDAHRRKELLLAAILLLEHPRSQSPTALPLRALIEAEDSPPGAALRGAFRRARAPIARRRAWQWLREGRVAPACAERVARAPTVRDHAALLSLGHLALAPTRAARLRLLTIVTRPAPQEQLPPGASPAARRLQPSGPLPDPAQLRALSAADRRQVPRLVSSFGGDETARSLALDPFLADPDPLARLGAARATPPPTLRDFCFDAHEAIARHAAIAWSACGTSESGRLRAGDPHRRRFAASLVRSPHPSVRSIAGEELARISPGPHHPAGALAARRALGADPAAFADWVREAVRAEDTGAAVAALMTCRRIGAIGAVEPLVLSIVRDSFGESAGAAPRVAATAVACLGDLRAARVAAVLTECLARHPDPRVRANAAEAIGRRRLPDRSRRILTGGAADDHHRVRASALRTLLAAWPDAKPSGDSAGAAVQGIISMLLDQRPAHRLAGVWVVQRALTGGASKPVGRRWPELASRVNCLAGGDPDPQVRARAAAVTRRLAAAHAATHAGGSFPP